MRALWAALLGLALLLGAHGAHAKFAVPPIQGHVTDTAKLLSPEDRADIEARLTRYMNELGVEVAVFVPASLEGETVEDVAYETFNTWKVGRSGLDNGVLLVIAPKERRVRIETGKGVGGQLTDLQSSDIIQHRISPKLRTGDYHGAIVDGVDSIAAALGSTEARQAVQAPPDEPAPLSTFLIFGVLLLVMVLFRGRLGGGGALFRGGGGGAGGGYFGGGGRSGGGGASGSW